MVMARLLAVFIFVNTRFMAQFGVYIMFSGMLAATDIELFSLRYWILLAGFIILMTFHDWAITNYK